jgi:hypothetical protein
MKGQTPKELFLEYRRETERLPNDLRVTNDIADVWAIEKRFVMAAYLAELYAIIASKRDGVNYLKKWREGK